MTRDIVTNRMHVHTLELHEKNVVVDSFAAKMRSKNLL